ncbi:VPLPA-CTERM sorting domain-containing protein [Epibacterium sp. SM1979]|uniref:VPLPA-CTERM sorting domain-containing protein n=1 Tax=Tritonibacter litoralis TaxID=2662264 RepID=A0A843Y8F9_9RHOB|nr:VPLPA-CTERM sorting domain-containing protein [Tritonibacter litoralis]MQQ07490.1 VPLPA-CTERM sorting domain-containing protein [Tritonibacter litoralis]
MFIDFKFVSHFVVYGKHNMKTQAAAISFASLMFATSASAASITFEDIAGMPPVDGLEITNQFAATAGVTFGLIDGSTGSALAQGPVLAEVGGPGTAFGGFGGGGDTIAPGSAAQIGNFFLTDDGLGSGGLRNPILVAEYSVASSFISADILDLDFSETFEIRFYDAVTGGNLLNTILLSASSPNTGNGVATTVNYDHGAAEILRVEFEGRSNRAPTIGFFGLGFDNFNSGVEIEPLPPSPIPLPAGLPLMLAGLAGFGVLRARRKSA